MAKTPIYLKLMIGIGMLIILASLYFLKDQPYYLWVRWTDRRHFMDAVH